jgi:hypothetical protein
MHGHISWRQRLATLIEHGGEPMFEMSDDPTLVAFAQIFAESELFTFDANRHLRADALTPIYDCETESRKAADAKPEKFVVAWAPVWQRDNPVTGFRTGRDSTFLGSTPTVAMPQDERTAALLLLVTSTFVHLSASREGPVPLIQGAAEKDDNTYRFLTLDPAAFTSPAAATTDPRQPMEKHNSR